MTCSTEGCQRQTTAKGLCRRHYTQAWRASKGNQYKEHAKAYNKSYIAKVKDSPEFKTRKAVYQRGWRARNAEYCKTHDYYGQRYLRAYGLDSASYAALLAQQEGVCAICKRASSKRRLAVDHDHRTGEVRGLLCDQCNHGLGMFRDDPSLCRKAARYLLDSQG